MSLAVSKEPSIVSCLYESDRSPFKKKLWDGYEISLGHTPHWKDEPEVGCTAAIYNKAGKVVYRTTGFNVVFEEGLTGKDFDGDTFPDVVFKTDTGGGNRGFWNYNLISLSPKPHHFLDVMLDGSAEFVFTKQGEVQFWRLTAGPYGYTSMALNPFADRVFIIEKGKLNDVTKKHCDRILLDPKSNFYNAKKSITVEAIKIFETTNDINHIDDEIKSHLLTVILQYIFCGQYDKAQEFLNHWPKSSRGKLKSDFIKSVQPDFPDLESFLAKENSTF
jgi:hypothetical protein